MRVMPRNSGTGPLNPMDSLLWISSLNFEYPEQIEVTAKVNHGGSDYTVEVEEIGGNPFTAPWEFGVGFDIEFTDWTLRITNSIPQGSPANHPEEVRGGPTNHFTPAVSSKYGPGSRRNAKTA